LNAFLYALLLLYTAELNLNESGKLVNAQLLLKYEKKELHDDNVVPYESKESIFETLNDHIGRLISAQELLKE
jgi:hypothetical protein